MTQRTRIVAVAICAAALLALGVNWFAFGQATNTPETPPSMDVPLVRDVNLEKQVEDLAKRVDALETTVERLKNEINEIRRNSSK